jgi:hypothetical protein
MQYHLSILSLSCWAIWVLFRKSLPMPINCSVFPDLSWTSFKVSGLILRPLIHFPWWDEPSGAGGFFEVVPQGAYFSAVTSPFCPQDKLKLSFWISHFQLTISVSYRWLNMFLISPDSSYVSSVFHPTTLRQRWIVPSIYGHQFCSVGCNQAISYTKLCGLPRAGDISSSPGGAADSLWWYWISNGRVQVTGVQGSVSA